MLRSAGGDDVVDYQGPVAVARREVDVAAALVVALGQLPWRSAALGGLVGRHPITDRLLAEVGRGGRPAQVTHYDSAPRIAAGSGPYLAGLNAKRRKEVLRKRGRLTEAAGPLELVATTADTWPEPLERLLAWKADATPATREFVATYSDFLRQLMARLSADGSAEIVELQAGGRPVASAIVFTHRNIRYLYNMSYDQAWLSTTTAGLAPGVVLVSLLAEQTVNAGQEFDFLRGGQSYKLQLGGVPDDLVRIDLPG